MKRQASESSCTVELYEFQRDTVITNVLLTFLPDAAGDYKFILHMFKSELFKTAYTAAEFPVSADLGQRLFFQVKVATNDTNLVLFIDYCKATPGKDRNNKNYYSIIHDGYVIVLCYIDGLKFNLFVLWLKEIILSRENGLFL